MNDKKNVIVAVGVVVLIAVIALLFFLLGGKSTYKVTFNSNGGSSVDSQEVKKGDKATEPTDPTRDGYTFSGWYLSLTDVTPYDFSKEVTENIELIAKWASNGEPSDDTCNLTCGENETLDKDKCECVTDTFEPEDPEKPENNTDTVAVTGITLNKSAVSLTVGKSETISATVKPNNATNKTVSWSSSNSKVATVDKNGKITAVGPGTATITAKAGNKSVSITVTVKADGSETKPQNKPVTELKLSTEKVEVEVGATVSVTATVNSDATDKTITWSSNNTGIATVSNGVIKGVSAGSTTITVKAGNITKTVTVTVKAKKPQYVVTLQRTKVEFGCGTQYIISVTKDGQPFTGYTSIAGLLTSGESWEKGFGVKIDSTLVNTGAKTVKLTTGDGTETATLNIIETC